MIREHLNLMDYILSRYEEYLYMHMYAEEMIEYMKYSIMGFRYWLAGQNIFDVDDITLKEVKGYQLYLRNHHISLDRQYMNLHAIRLFLSWLEREGYIDKSPAAGLELTQEYLSF